VLPSGATSVRLYAVAHGKERLLTDFPLGEPEPEQKSPLTRPAALEAFEALEARLEALEARLEALEGLAQADEDDDYDDTPPAWLSAIGRDLLGQLGLGAVSAPQEQVGEQESAE
jgi:hypothetical protein